jgi:hypothetical protein
MVSVADSISKPWGDSGSYDVGVQHGPDILRVQVKSTTVRTGTGYFCQFKPNYFRKQDYTVEQIDVFAAYVIPQDVWYLIPAAIILGPTRKTGLMLFPMEPLKNRTAVATPFLSIVASGWLLVRRPAGRSAHGAPSQRICCRSDENSPRSLRPVCHNPPSRYRGKPARDRVRV